MRGNPIAQQYAGRNRGKNGAVFRRRSARGLDLQPFRCHEVPCSRGGTPTEDLAPLPKVPKTGRVAVKFGAHRAARLMTNEESLQFEHLPAGMPMDETDVSLRAYLSRLSDEHL